MIPRINSDAHFLQGLLLNLTNARACDSEMYSYFLERLWLAIVQPKSHRQNAALTRVKRRQRLPNQLVIVVADDSVEGSRRIGIRYDIRDGIFILCVNG